MAIRVFLVDDHAVVRDGLRMLLEAETDIKVVGQAADGRQAVEQVQNLKPEVVVMDIAMPELNGVEATFQILQRCPDIKVIILSMHSSSEHVFRALKAGVRGYLLKESAGVELVNAVRVVHKGRYYLTQRTTETLVNDYVRTRHPSLAQSPLESLSSREREVLQMVVEGKSSAVIARTLHLSPKTVETYRSRLMQKLKITGIPGLVKFAIHHGLTSSE